MSTARRNITLSSLAVLAAGAAAWASMQVGTTFSTTESGQVFARFFSSTTPAGTGQLYFTSYQPSGASITTVTSDTYYALGKSLFNNREYAQGYSVYLGTFDAGTTLNFSYRSVVGSPSGSGPSKTYTIRTDTAGDASFFGFNAANDLALGSLPRLSFEDQKLTTTDFDRNDMVFDLVTSPMAVPAPAGVSLAILGLAVMARRARRD